MPYTQRDRNIDFDRFTHVDDLPIPGPNIIQDEAEKLDNRTGIDVEIAVDPEAQEALLITPGHWSGPKGDSHANDYTVLSQGELEWVNYLLGNAYREGRQAGLKRAKFAIDRHLES